MRLTHIKKFSKIYLLRALKFVLRFVLAVFLLSHLALIAFKWIPVPITPLMIIRCIENVADGNEVRIIKEWKPINEISPSIVTAVVASEDNLFMKHNGFDWDAIEKARANNDKGKKLRGGSTISQQTAKNVFLYPSRTYVRKALEAYYTFWIELVWGKERIMEVYLNVCETGHGIYGVEKASQVFFGKSAMNVSADEATLIATSIPCPLKLNPHNPSKYMRTRQAKIKKLMRLIGKVDLTKTDSND